MSKGSARAHAKIDAKRGKAQRARGRLSYGGNVAASSWTEQELEALAWVIATLRGKEKRTVKVTHVCAACGERAEIEVEVKLDDLSSAAAYLEHVQSKIGAGGASLWFGGR